MLQTCEPGNSQGDFSDKDMGDFNKRIKWPISHSISRACVFLFIFILRTVMCLVTDFSRVSGVLYMRNELAFYDDDLFPAKFALRNYFSSTHKTSCCFDLLPRI